LDTPTSAPTSTNEDLEDFEFSEDDFTQIQTKLLQQGEEKSPSTTGEQEQATQEQPQVQLFGFPKQEHYYYEMGFLSFILIAVVVYFIGRSSGDRLFREWAEKNLVRQVLEKHFTKVNFMRDAANQYIIYATGNEAIKHITLKVTLPNKQDLLMGLLFKPLLSMLNGGAAFGKTEVVLEITMPRRFALLFGFCEPKSYKNFLKQHEPLQLYTKHAQVEVDGRQFAVFTDTRTLIEKLMSQSFISFVENDFLISDLLKPRTAGTKLIQCITWRATFDFKKTLAEGDKYSSKFSKKSKFDNWLDELIHFVSFEFNLTQQEAEKNIKNRLEVKENIEKEKQKQKLKEESKENRIKKLKKK